MKMYKAAMLTAAALTAVLMAWCGVSAAITAPVLVIHAVENRSANGLLMLTVLALSGLIASMLSRRIPSPFPQLLMSAALGTGYTAVTAWMGGLTADQLAGTLDALLLRSFQTTGLVLPSVAALSAFFSLPAFLTKRIRRRSHALLCFLALLALIAAADAAMAVLDLPVLTWQRIAQALPILATSRCRSLLLAATEAYTSIPLLVRLIAGAFLLMILGRALYVAGCRKLRRRTASASSRPPASRPASPAAQRSQPRQAAAPPSRPAALRPSPASPAAQRSQPRQSGINARDSALLDALAAQTISGLPIGLNTATGVPSVTGTRRS